MGISIVSISCDQRMVVIYNGLRGILERRNTIDKAELNYENNSLFSFLALNHTVIFTSLQRARSPIDCRVEKNDGVKDGGCNRGYSCYGNKRYGHCRAT